MMDLTGYQADNNYIYKQNCKILKKKESKRKARKSNGRQTNIIIWNKIDTQVKDKMFRFPVENQ